MSSLKMKEVYELKEQGMDLVSIAKKLNLTKSTCQMYYYTYKRSLTQEKKQEKQETFTTLEEEILRIGKDYYEIETFRDVTDDTIWFDFMEIMNSLAKEEIINTKEFKTKIPNRYFRDEAVNGKHRCLIDRMALMELAKEVGDYTFITSVLEINIGDVTDTFYKFNQILNSFEIIENLIANIERKYDEVKAFNSSQFDILHQFDNEKFLTDEQLLEKSKKILSLRLARRTVRNEAVLSQNLRRLLREYGVNVANINTIRNKLGRLVDDLYYKKYNPRTEQLEEWQKELVDLE